MIQPALSHGFLSFQVGEEASKSDIDDPWPAKQQTKQRQANGDHADEPEPLPTLLLDETLPIDARELWRLIMADPEFLVSVNKLKKNREIKIGRWRPTKGECIRRPLAAPVNSGNAPAISTHLAFHMGGKVCTGSLKDR